MRSYEALVIFPAQTPGESIQDGKNVFEDTVKKHEGKVVTRNELGRRLLGYTVKKQKEGNFVSFVFELAPEKTDAFKRALQLSDEILKFTITKWEKALSPNPRRRLSKPMPTGHAAHAGEKR